MSSSALEGQETMTRESDGASTTLVTTEEQDIDAVMRIITSLRTKHQPQVTVGDSVHTVSTVGLVVGGTRIERVVPGGPCDREFHAERIEPEVTRRVALAEGAHRHLRERRGCVLGKVRECVCVGRWA